MTPQQYDAWYDSPRGRWIGDTEWQLLGRLLLLRPGDTVLDVGCGTGWFTRRAAAEGAEVTGLDTDAAALAFARAHSSSAVRYVEGDACSLPFADRSFDAVLSVTVLCFVVDWPKALSEIVRVSRRRFAVGLLNQHSLLWLDKGRRSGQGAYAGAHWHTQREVDTALRRLGTPRIAFGYAVFLPSATRLTRAIEPCMPTRIPLGPFMAMGGDSAHRVRLAISGGRRRSIMFCQVPPACPPEPVDAMRGMTDSPTSPLVCSLSLSHDKCGAGPLLPPIQICGPLGKL